MNQDMSGNLSPAVNRQPMFQRGGPKELAKILDDAELSWTTLNHPGSSWTIVERPGQQDNHGLFWMAQIDHRGQYCTVLDFSGSSWATLIWTTLENMD